MAETKKQFRHELKYLISLPDAELLKRRIAPLMKPDEHAVNGRYTVRSLYFDDYWHSAYQQKLMGVGTRNKYRIRIYNASHAVIRLERKQKVDHYIHKTTVPLTRQETEAILHGQYDFLLEKEQPLYTEFYFQCVSRVMRPAVIVEYVREPFVYPVGDVRVTFDREVGACGDFCRFFDSDLPLSYVLQPGKVVMEVKFTECLPSLVRQILPCGNEEYTALSKYTACFEATNISLLHCHSGI